MHPNLPQLFLKRSHNRLPLIDIQPPLANLVLPLQNYLLYWHLILSTKSVQRLLILNLIFVDLTRQHIFRYNPHLPTV